MTAPTPLAALLDALDLERIETDTFRGHQPVTELGHVQRVFGGQVAAQALMAAGRTVGADRPVHSLHSYFLRPGDPGIPIVFTVDRIRDGRTFTTRRVVAVQHGKAIFNLHASFTTSFPGYQHAVAMPEVPAPADLPLSSSVLDGYEDALYPGALRARPIDLRFVTEPLAVAATKGLTGEEVMVWLRAHGTLPDDPLVHACVAAFASDWAILDAVMIRHGANYGPHVEVASLDHAVWFHRPFRVDEWFLYHQESPWADLGRGLAHGRLFTHDGHLAASVVQEGMIRLLRPDATVEESATQRGETTP